ncbi:MAG: tetratricopeptide repeat protein [Myxococcota bacterium]|nr:tetratricopeptide repeat protein [Myxococcota bacterium]
MRTTPNDANALAHLGAVHLKLNNTEVGLKHLSRAGLIDKTNASIAFWEGEALLAAARPLDAFDAYRRAISLEPERKQVFQEAIEPRLYRAIASALSQDSKRLSRSLKILKLMSDDLPARFPATFARLAEVEGDVLFGRGSTHAAISCFRKAHATGAAQPSVIRKIGEAHAVLRELEQANARFAEWVEKAPQHEQSARRLKVARFLESRFILPTAIRWYELALKHAEDPQMVRMALATVLLKSKKSSRAQEILGQILTTTDSHETAASVGRLWVTFKKVDDALDAYNRAITLAPAELQYWTIIARLLASAGRASELESIIGRPNAHLRWGRVYIELGDWATAANHLEKSLTERGSERSDARLLLARAYHRLGKPKKRDASLSSFVKVAQDPIAALKAVAAVYTSLSLMDPLEATWRDILVKSPTDEKAAFGLAALLKDRGTPEQQVPIVRTWAMAHQPGNRRAHAWLRVARYWMKSRRGNDAMHAVEQALTGAEGVMLRQALLLGATIEQRLRRRYKRAESLYTRWIALAPSADKKSEARLTVIRRTRGLTRMGRYRIQLLEVMCQEEPRQAKIFYELGEALLQLKPPEALRARKAFETYIALSGETVASTVRVGLQLIRYNAFTEAANILTTVAPADISDPAIHIKLVRLYLRGSVSNRTRATQHVARLLLLLDKPAVAMQRDMLRLANQLEHAGLYAQAVGLLTRLRRAGQPNARILRRLGKALLGQKKEAQAITVFDEYLKHVGGRRAIRDIGDLLYEKGYYQLARTYYLRIFARSGRAHLARLFPRLIDIHLKLGDRDGIRGLAKKYTELLPNARSHADAARRLQQVGLTEEAYTYWTSAARFQPNASHFREQQARMALALGKDQDAMTAINALVARTKDVQTWVRAGRLLSERGYDTEALSVFAQAVKSGVHAASLQRAKAAVLARCRRVGEAYQALHTALVNGNDLDGVLQDARDIFLPRGERQRYRQLLERTVVLHPERSATWLELGDLSALSGDVESAMRLWRAHLEKEPRGAVPVAKRLAGIGDYDSAQRLLFGVISSENAESRSDALSDLLGILVASGRYESLMSVIDRFLSNGTKPTRDMASIARGLSDQGWVAMGIHYLGLALAAEPVPDGWYRLARLHLMRGEVAKASDAFGRFLGGQHQSPKKRHMTSTVERLGRIRQIALTWEEFGENQTAIDFLESAIQEQPDIGTLSVHLSRLRLAQGDVMGALDALDLLLRSRTSASRIDAVELDALEALLVAFSRQREAISVLTQIPIDIRPTALAVTLVNLSLGLGETEAVETELARVLAMTSEGGVRYTLAKSHFDAGMYLEARELLESVFEPGRGLGAVGPAMRLLLTVGRIQDDKRIVARVRTLAEAVYEDRAELHRHLAESLYAVGEFTTAAEEAASWAGAVGAAPTGDKVLDEKAPHPWRLQIRIALRRGDEGGARQAVNDFIDVAERPLDARRNMAMLLRRLDAFNIARDVLLAGSVAGARDRSTYFTLAQLSLDVGEPKDAETWLARYLELGDTWSVDHRRIARLWLEYGYYSRANRLLADIAPIDPFLDDTEFVFWAKRNAPERLVESAYRAAELAQSPSVALARLASRYLRTTDIPPKVAKRLAQRGMELATDGEHPLLLLIAAAAQAELGNDDAAWSTLQRSLSAGPADYVAILSPGKTLGPLQARRVAIAAFIAKAVLGERLELISKAVGLLTKQGKPSELQYAASVLREALTLKDDTNTEFQKQVATIALKTLSPLRYRPEYIPSLVDTVADLQERAGEATAAIATYQEAIEKFPGTVSFTNNLAYLFARRNERLEYALTLVDAALARNPEGAAAYLDTKGWILHRVGRHTEAATLIEESLRHMAGGPTAAIAETVYHLGHIYIALGRSREAENVLHRAVRLDEDGVYGRKASELLRVLFSGMTTK